MPPFSLQQDSLAASRRWLVTMLVIVVLGSALRAALYARGVSFWGDEACLLVNVISKTSTELVTTRLDSAGPNTTQAGPPLFLLAVRASVVGWGPAPPMFVPSEYAARAVPLACSVLSILLCAALARMVLGRTHWAFAAVLLLAFSPPAVAQANNVKQYSGDLAIAAGLLALAVRSRATDGSARGLLLVALTSATTLWISHATAFVFGAISLGFLVTLARSTARERVAWLVGNAIFAGSFIAMYVTSVSVQTDEYLKHFWLEKFPPASMLGWPTWVVENTWELFNYFHAPIGILLVPPIVIGFVSLKRAGRLPLAIALAGPVGLIFVAAVLRQYPFGGTRLALFTLPGLAILAAVGLRACASEVAHGFHLKQLPLSPSPATPGEGRGGGLFQDETGPLPDPPPRVHRRGAERADEPDSEQHRPRLPTVVRIGATTIMTMVILVGAGRAIYEVSPMSYRSDVRPALAYALARRTPTEPIIVDARSSVVARLYWPAADAASLIFSPDLNPTPSPCWLVTDINSAGRLKKIKARMSELTPRTDTTHSYFDRGGAAAYVR